MDPILHEKNSRPSIFSYGAQSIVRDTGKGLIFTVQRYHAIPSTIRIAKLSVRARNLAKSARTEFTCGLWKPETVTGFAGRIQLGRAGPVELATEVKVQAPLEEG